VAEAKGLVKEPTPRRLRKYVAQCLGLKAYLRCPGDGRSQGRTAATALLWALFMGVLLRRAAFAGIEALVRSRARRALAVSQSFGDDALGYFTERLDPAVTRQAAVTALRHTKRHKAFDHCPFIGLALDGTGAGRSRQKGCDLCRPCRNQKREILGYHHQLVLLSVVGTALTLPLDVEPYGPGDSEYLVPVGGSSAVSSATSAAVLPTTWWSMETTPPPLFCTTLGIWDCPSWPA